MLDRISLLSVRGAFSIFGVFLVTYLIRKVLAIQIARRGLKNHHGRSIMWLAPLSPAAFILAPIFPPKGSLGNWFDGFLKYQKEGSTYLSAIFFSDATATHWFADADAFKSVVNKRSAFVKGDGDYDFLKSYGPNIFTVDGQEWKRHRSVAKTAFSDGNNIMVWENTMLIMDKWFADMDKTVSERSNYATVNVLTGFVRVTMSVFLTAAFGRSDSWADSKDEAAPPGYKMSFRAALVGSLDCIMFKAIFPPWMFDFSNQIYIPLITPLLQKTSSVYDTLQLHLLDIIKSAEQDNAGQSTSLNGALLQNLVAANMAQEDSSDLKLTRQEVVSNTYLSLIAGHDSTAHTLCFVALLLAIHPHIQRKVYEEAVRLWPTEPSYNESITPYKEGMATLEYTLAVLFETLRIFPSVRRLPKEVTVDTVLKYTRFTPPRDGGAIVDPVEDEVMVKAGSTVVLDIYAMQMNPIHWGKDVTEFRPERFIDTDTYRWPRDAFGAFMRGSRSCLGERFAITECVCAIARMVRRYEISPPDELQKMPFEKQKEVMLKYVAATTTTPAFTNAKFTRRC